MDPIEVSQNGPSLLVKNKEGVKNISQKEVSAEDSSSESDNYDEVDEGSVSEVPVKSQIDEHETYLKRSKTTFKVKSSRNG